MIIVQIYFIISLIVLGILGIFWKMSDPINVILKGIVWIIVAIGIVAATKVF